MRSDYFAELDAYIAERMNKLEAENAKLKAEMVKPLDVCDVIDEVSHETSQMLSKLSRDVDAKISAAMNSLQAEVDKKECGISDSAAALGHGVNDSEFTLGGNG